MKTQPLNVRGNAGFCRDNVLLCLDNPTGARTLEINYAIDADEHLQYPCDKTLYDEGRTTTMYFKFASVKLARR